jgi:predicted acyl esterase
LRRPNRANRCFAEERIVTLAEQSRPQFRVLVEKDVPSKTRDGLTLRADVYRPDSAGRFPVLLSRLPYDKNLRARPGDIDYFVERGCLSFHLQPSDPNYALR